MRAHSTAVDLCQNDVGHAPTISPADEDVFVQLRQLQDNHLWMQQQLQQLLRCTFTRRLQQQRRLFQSCVALETKLRQLQHKYHRHWGL